MKPSREEDFAKVYLCLCFAMLSIIKCWLVLVIKLQRLKWNLDFFSEGRVSFESYSKRTDVPSTHVRASSSAAATTSRRASSQSDRRNRVRRSEWVHRAPKLNNFYRKNAGVETVTFQSPHLDWMILFRFIKRIYILNSADIWISDRTFVWSTLLTEFTP